MDSKHTGLWTNLNTLQTYSDEAVEELISLGLVEVVEDEEKGVSVLRLTPAGLRAAQIALSERN